MNPPEIPWRIRPARRTDAAAIAAIANHYILHSTANFREEPETVAERERWVADHVPPHAALVAEDPAGVVLGWASLSRFHPRSAYRHTAEDSVYLHPDHLGRGLGTALLQELIALATANRLHAVVALISADQGASLALHRRLGFVEVGRLREVGRKFDAWLDVIYLQRMLTPT